MLVANLKNGKRISLLDMKEKKGELNFANEFFCPECAEPVILKAGTQRIWHFSHVNKNECFDSFERESEYHQAGKIELFKWLKRQLKEVHLEYYISELNQRPDIYFEDALGNQFAVEYQCSTIDEKLFIQRTQGYLSIGITPIWILGGNRMNRKASHYFKLTSFDWLNLGQLNQSFHLLYFDPYIKKLLLLHQILPFSSTSVVANFSIKSLEDISYSFLTNPQANVNSTQQYSTWIKKLNNWRFSNHNIIHKEFQRYCYQHGFPSSLFPVEAGIPIQLSNIKTAPMVWQTIILIECIYPLRIDEQLSIYKVMHTLKKSHQIHVRQYPLITIDCHREAILAYFDALCIIGVLEKQEESVYKKITNLQMPIKIDDAVRKTTEMFACLNHDKIMKSH